MSEVKTYWANLPKNYHYEETAEYERLAKLLIETSDSIFECSTGSGILPTVLRKYGFKGKYLGSDYVDNFLAGAKENNPNEEFIKVDLFKPIPLPDKSFDSCVVHHGLEYVYPYKPALKELKRIAKKRIFLSFWVGFMEENNIRFTEEKGWNVNYYSKKEFLDTLEELGLELEMKGTIKNEDDRVNYWYILKV